METLLVETANTMLLTYNNISVQNLIDEIKVAVPRASSIMVKDIIFNALWPMLTKVTAEKNKNKEA